MNDLDAMLREALDADADRAPSLPVAWVGPTTATVVPIAPRRSGHRSALAVAGIATAAAAVGVLALVTRPDDAAERVPASAPIPPPWQPAGIEFEFPLDDLGPATSVPDGPVVAALTREITVADHPNQLLTTSISYQGGITAIVQQCAWENGGGGCRPEWNPATWSTSVTSSIENSDAGYDLWTVEGLPAGAAFVSYTDGDVVLWQRPVAGFAAFPNVVGTDELVIAYDAVGTELGRYDNAAYTQVATLAEPPLRADISQEQFDALTELTEASMGACLTGQGGDIGDGGVATFTEGVDQLAVWSQCVVEVKAIVAQRVAVYAPTFFDPATERPQHPETPWVYGD